MSRMLGDLLSIFQTSKFTNACWLARLVKAKAKLIILGNLGSSCCSLYLSGCFIHAEFSKFQNLIHPEFHKLIRHPGLAMLGKKGNAGRAQTHYSWEADLWCGSLYLANTNRKIQIEIHVEVRIEIHL